MKPGIIFIRPTSEAKTSLFLLLRFRRKFVRMKNKFYVVEIGRRAKSGDGKKSFQSKTSVTLFSYSVAFFGFLFQKNRFPPLFLPWGESDFIKCSSGVYQL